MLVGAILWNDLSLATILLLVALLGTWEFLKTFRNAGIAIQTLPCFLLALVAYILPTGILFELWTIEWLLLLLPAFLLVPITELFRNKKEPFSNIGLTLLPSIYLALPASLANHIDPLAGDPDHNYVTLGVFILIWSHDTGAYVSGKLLGKHKLLERISPGKTWEGSIGGTLLCLGAGYMLSTYTPLLALHEWAIMALLIAIFGTFGDLTISLLKRGFGLKDSGKLLPGHGGILDRFDAFLFAVPMVVFYLALFR